MTEHPLVLALTGASGAPYGVRLLEVLARHRVPVWLIASSHGMRLLEAECGIGSLEELREATGGDFGDRPPCGARRLDRRALLTRAPGRAARTRTL